MKNEHLFISDVHLGLYPGEKNQHIENDLATLIRYCIEEKCHLYILGDLFDYWMEFPNSSFIPEIGRKILALFSEYNRKVTPALYITGNHDNWTLNYFEDCGFDVEHEFRKISLDTQQAILFHGDGKLTQQELLKRPILHVILRNWYFLKIFRFFFRNELGILLMKRFSQFSRLHETIDPIPLDLNAEWIIENKDVDVVICGHDHIPRTKLINRSTYINLGTFYKHRTIARYYNNEINLVTWNSTSKEFLPYPNK